MELPAGSPFDAARAVSAAIRRRGGGPVHLLAGSWGGLVARCLPPEQVLGMALIATLPHPRHCPAWLGPLRRALMPLPAPAVEAAYRRRLARGLRRDGVPPGLASALAARGLSKQVLLSRLKSARCRDIPRAVPPSLWLRGREDPQVSWTAHEIRATHPGAEMDSVPGAHRPYASHPAALLERLRPWWARCEAGAGF